jgi:hypothetical protein
MPPNKKRSKSYSIIVIGGKARAKETTRKIKTYVGGYYYDGSFRDRLGRCGLDWSSSGQEQVESSCECSYELSGSIKS